MRRRDDETDSGSIRSARRLLDIASVKGEYRLYERAVAAFDRAVASGVGDDLDVAERGRILAHIAYAREALVNRDFELALSLVEPFAERDRDARELRNRILRKRLHTRITGERRPRRLYVLVGLAAVAVVVAVNFIEYGGGAEDSGAKGALVEMFERGVRARSAVSLPIEFDAILTEMTARRNFLQRYESFKPLFSFMNDRREAVLSARGGIERAATRAACRIMLEGMERYRFFLAELRVENDVEAGMAVRVLMERLDSFVIGLEEWGREEAEARP